MVLPKISKNLNIPRKPLVLRTCAARCHWLYLSTVSQPTGVYKCTCFRVLAVFFTPFSCVSAIIKMGDVKEQKMCIKFCFKLNKTAGETHQMPEEAFGEQALSQARTFEWFEHFKDGRESVEDHKHSGQLSTCTTPEMIAKVREVILVDRRQTNHDVGKFHCEVLKWLREMAWDVEERRLVVAPWQCAYTHLSRCEGVPDKK